MTSTDGLSPGLVAALARAQMKFAQITKAHENPHFKSKYADLSDVLQAVRPALNTEGVWLTQPLETDDDGRVRLFTRLEGYGEVREASLPVHLDNLTPQQLLSTLTYYRRGMLAAMLGVAAEDDDDGNQAQTAPSNAPPRQASGSFGPAEQAPPDWKTRPLASMTFGELRGVAALVGHAFTGGSKSELIRQLEPLVRALSGEEPFDVTTNAPVSEGAAVADSGISALGLTTEANAIPFDPVVALPANSGSGRKQDKAVRDDVR